MNESGASTEPRSDHSRSECRHLACPRAGGVGQCRVTSASCGAVFGKVSRRGGSQGPVVALGGPWHIGFVGCCHNKVSQSRWLIITKFILSQFWRPDVQSQGIRTAALSPEPQGGALLASSGLWSWPAVSPWLPDAPSLVAWRFLLCGSLCLHTAFS